MFLLTPQDEQLRFTLGEGEPFERSGALDIGAVSLTVLLLPIPVADPKGGGHRAHSPPSSRQTQFSWAAGWL